MIASATRRLRVPVIVCALVAACSPDLGEFAQKFTTPAERAFARGYLELVANGSIDSAYAQLSPDLLDEKTFRALRDAGTALRSAYLDSLKFIGVNVLNYRGSRRVNLSYEGPAQNSQWVICNVATSDDSGRVRVIGFSAYIRTRSLESENAFTLEGKGLRFYAWIVFVMLMPVAPIAVAIMVSRTKGMPRRWVWAPVALISTPVLALNWTTGEISMQGLSFVLFGASALRASAAAPWTISWALPTGALVAFVKRRNWLSRRSQTLDVAA